MPGRIAARTKTVHMLIREPNFDANIPGKKIDKVNMYRFDELPGDGTLEFEDIVDDRHVAATVQQQLMRTRMRMESDDEDGAPKPAAARIAGSSQLSSLTDSVEDMDDGTFSAVAVEKLIVRHSTLLASGKDGVASSLHRTSSLLKRPGASLLGAAAKRLNVAGDKKVI
ncbi:hypothetical protein GGI24_001107 [Coemansia furcata]|nr:hypothetical protein GGI24_001107 [Coemansia furcata]